MDHLSRFLSGYVVGRPYLCARLNEVAGTKSADCRQVLVVSLPLLPLHLPAGREPPAQGNPAPWILVVLSLAVDLPFFALAFNTAILQRWFADSGHTERHDRNYIILIK
jgi:hypothetical protein